MACRCSRRSCRAPHILAVNENSMARVDKNTCQFSIFTSSDRKLSFLCHGFVNVYCVEQAVPGGVTRTRGGMERDLSAILVQGTEQWESRLPSDPQYSARLLGDWIRPDLQLARTGLLALLGRFTSTSNALYIKSIAITKIFRKPGREL
jgi:hypothetical protein